MMILYDVYHNDNMQPLCPICKNIFKTTKEGYWICSSLKCSKRFMVKLQEVDDT